VVDRTFSRSGFVAFVAQGGGEVTRRRKGTGAAVNLVMPRYSNDEPCGYHGNLHASAHHGAVHPWAMSRAGTVATCTATCDGPHGRRNELPVRDQRLLCAYPHTRECGVLWRHLPAQEVLGEPRRAPCLACKCPPRRSRPLPHRWAPTRASRPQTAPSIRPRRRHPYAQDGAIHTPKTAPPIRPRRRHVHAHGLGARESAGLHSRACDGLRPPQEALPDH
jgi:hypothetical protein